MGGAFTALANDPSAVFFNPAGLTQLSGTHILGGVTLIKPSSTFRGPSPSIQEWKMDDQIFNPINLYVTHQFNEDFSAGLSINNPYGLGTLWDENWIGKYLAIETEIRTFFFTPVVAYKISDNLSIGGGPVITYGDVIIHRKSDILPFEGDAVIELEGTGTGFGYTAGVLFKPTNELSLGLTFRSEVEMNFEGDANVTAPSQLGPALPTGKIKAPLTTPLNVTFGLAALMSPELTLTADFQYVGWNSYDKLEVEFLDFKDENGDNLIQSSIRDYGNGWIGRLGGEYKFDESLDIRAGVFYDSNPVKDEKLDPTLPDADRLGFNIGFGYRFSESLSVDLAYLFLRFEERKITNSEEEYSPGSAKFNGVYNSSAHLLGINFSYSF